MLISETSHSNYYYYYKSQKLIVPIMIGFLVFV